MEFKDKKKYALASGDYLGCGRVGDTFTHHVKKKDGGRGLLFARNVALLLEKLRIKSSIYKKIYKLRQVRSPIKDLFKGKTLVKNYVDQTNFVRYII